MLYLCFNCNSYSFHRACPLCGPEKMDENIPLDPKYYPEFQYQSQGLIKDIFMKRKTEKELQDKLMKVLEKYSNFEKPYFVNYVHINRNAWEQAYSEEQNTFSNEDLFKNVLIRLGFNELNEFPQLTRKLFRSTIFRFRYSNFINQIKNYILSNLSTTLKSWIEEAGFSFRNNIPLMLFYLWQENKFVTEIQFANSTALQNGYILVADNELTKIKSMCEEIYLDINISRFKTKLERFDPANFVTMYNIDYMDGFEFEDFLEKLLNTLGYDVEKTQRTKDQGADLFASKYGQKIVIQAKNYMENVGNSAIQQVIAAKTFYSCDKAIVITNSYFTNSAIELANSIGVELLDRNKLQSFLDDYNAIILENSNLNEA